MKFYTFRQVWPLYYSNPNFAPYMVIQAETEEAAAAILDKFYLEETGCSCKHCKHNYQLVYEDEWQSQAAIPEGAEARVFYATGYLLVINGYDPLANADYLFREGTGKVAMSIKVTGAEFRELYKQHSDEEWELYDLENLKSLSS